MIKDKESEEDTTHRTKIYSDRLIQLRPEVGGQDFNDCQFSQLEIDKLQKLSSVYTPPKIKKTKKDKNEINIHPDLKNFKEKVNSCIYEIRKNVRKEQIEIKNFNNDKKWIALDKEGISELYFKISNAKNAKGETKDIKLNMFDKLFEATASENRVDPFKEYLEGLKWDQKPRIDIFLECVFRITKDFKLARWAFKSILLAVVYRTYEPGFKYDEMPIFQGEQGIGKSELLSELFYDKTLFSNTVDFKDNSREFTNSLLGKALIEVADLYGFKKASISKIKNLITSTQDTARLPYDKRTKDYLKRCVFVGTTNERQSLPNDLTGLRRFIPIELKRRYKNSELISLVREHRDMIWAEIVHCYKEGHDPRLPKNLWELSKQASERHRSADDYLEGKLKEQLDFYKPTTRVDNNIQTSSDPNKSSFKNPHLDTDNKYFHLPTALENIYGNNIQAIQKNQSQAGKILRKWGYIKEDKKIGKITKKVWFKIPT